jgi:hypothetical protein
VSQGRIADPPTLHRASSSPILKADGERTGVCQMNALSAHADSNLGPAINEGRRQGGVSSRFEMPP